MTLTTLATALATNVGMSIPVGITGQTDRNALEIVQTTQEAADEITRRVDWRALQRQYGINGEPAGLVEAPLPAYFQRVVPGSGVVEGASRASLRPMSAAEWQVITPAPGVPRYYSLAVTTSLVSSIRFHPYMVSGQTCLLHYYSSAWCSNGTNKWSADDNTALISEDLILKGSIVRWRRRKGMDYADFEAEYEAAMSDAAAFDDGGAV